MSQYNRTVVFHPAFSPWLADPEQLSRTLVGNEGIIRDFLARLTAMDSGASANHVLLVGPRGIGKTHLLCLTGHHVSRRLPPPQDWVLPGPDWICALFTEEEYAGQNSLANFLLTLFEKLNEIIQRESLLGLPPDLSSKPDKAVVECCFETLRRFHRKTGKRLLILVDNLQKVLQQWSIEEHHQLRKFLSAGRFVVILGSAPSVFREVLDQKAALHDFFEIRILSELTTDQVMELLGKRFAEDLRAEEFSSRREELARKVSAIEVLTGGNPRLVLFLYQIATGSAFWEIETALRMLLEELREYFVRRFDELPDQARKILDTIAQMPGPATPSEIAVAARVRPQLVNAQLQRLKAGHLVRQVKLKRQRATRYDITERLFRIWRQTATVAGRQRFKFLADFLRLYFTPEEVQSLYRQHVSDLSSCTDTSRDEILKHVEELYYFQAGGEGQIRYDAFTSRIDSLRKLGEMRWAEEEARYFEAASSRLGDKAGIVAAYKQELILHLDAGRLAEALDDLKNLLKVYAFEEVVAGAETIVGRNPDLQTAWLYLAMAFDGLGNFNRMLEAVRNAAQTGQPSAEILSLESLALSGLGKNEEGLRVAEEAINLDSTSPESWIALGIAADNLGDMDRALHAFGNVVATRRPAELKRLLSTLSQNLARSNEVLRVTEATINSAPEDPAGSTEFDPALEATRRGIKIAKLVTQLSQLVSSSAHALCREDLSLIAGEAGKNVALFWSVLSILSSKLGQKDESLQAIEQSVALDPTNAEAWRWLGRVSFRWGEHSRAVEAFSKVIEIGKPTSESWLFQSAALASLSRIEQSASAAEQAVALDPTNGEAWRWLGLVSLLWDKDSRAVEAFSKAIEIGKPTSDLLRLKSIALASLSRKEQSVAAAEQAVALDPTNAKAWTWLGNIALSCGMYNRALDAFRKAAENDKPTAELWRLQSRTFRSLNRLDDALQASEQAVALDPENSQAWLEMAWTRGYIGQLTEALSAIQRAAACGAPDRDIRHARGDVLLLAGRYEEALGTLEMGLEQNPDDWDMRAGSKIARACLGEFGPLMEALPAQLLNSKVPPDSELTVCEFLRDVALNSLRRKETGVPRGLWNALLSLESYQGFEWYGPLCGDFLRRMLDLAPCDFAEYAEQPRGKVKYDDSLKLLNPFLQAAAFIKTKDVTILERLFPEVRELVLDIVRRVSPDLVDQLRL